MKEKVKKFLNELEKVADEIVNDQSILDKKSEFRRRASEMVKKDPELMTVYEKNSLVIHEFFSFIYNYIV